MHVYTGKTKINALSHKTTVLQSYYVQCSFNLTKSQGWNRKSPWSLSQTFSITRIVWI